MNVRHIAGSLFCVLISLVLWTSSVSFAVDANETCLARAFIPSAENVHGESRLIRMGDAACLETIIHSASFRRGIKEILARETATWPEIKPGYEDSKKCREEIEKAKQAVLDKPRSQDDLGRPYTLLMRYIFQPGNSRVEFLHAEVERGTDTFAIKSSSPISNSTVSDEYMSRAMLIMTTAALGPERNDSKSLLESAGWRDLSPQVDVTAAVPAH